MEKQAKITLLSFGVLSICAIFAMYFLMSFAGATSETSTVSNATVAVSIGFAFSDNLTGGILYGSVNPNTNDNNASGNNLTAGNTAYSITMDTANNANSDTCIKANANLTSGGNIIDNGNYTYDANSTITGGNMNNPAGSIAITGSYVVMGDINLAAEAVQYAQFYLDVPAQQAAGAYNNTVSFKIVQTGSGC